MFENVVNMKMKYEFFKSCFSAMLLIMTDYMKQNKNGPNKICKRQSLKNLKRFGLPKAHLNPSNFLRLSCPNFTWSILGYFVTHIPSLRKDNSDFINKL